MARVVPVGDKAFGSGSFEPIPAGTKLRVSVFDIEETKVKSGPNTGKDQFVVNFKVTEEGPYLGREIRYCNFPLYEGPSSWTLAALASAVGWGTDADTKSVSVPDNLREVLGTELIVKVNVRQRDGKTYNGFGGAQKLGKGTPVAKTPEKSWGDV